MKLVNRWEKDLDFYFIWDIMEQGIDTGDMYIFNLIGLGQWVGYLMDPR